MGDEPSRSSNPVQLRPICMRSRTFSDTNEGLPEVTDIATAESTLLVYVLHTGLDEEHVKAQYDLICLMENRYISMPEYELCPRRMMLVFESADEAEGGVSWDVASRLEADGLIHLEAVALDWSLKDTDGLWELACHIARTLVQQRSDSPKANADTGNGCSFDVPAEESLGRIRLTSPLGGAGLP